MKTIDLNTYQKLIRQAGSLPIKKHKRVARQVATILLTYVNFKSGRCDPSEATLAKDLDICERSVRNGLLALSKAGLIRVGKRKGRTNQYDLLFIDPGKFEQAPRKNQVDTPASLNTYPGKFEHGPRNEHATEQVRTRESTNENSKNFGEKNIQSDSFASTPVPEDQIQREARQYDHAELVQMLFNTFKQFSSNGIEYPEFLKILGHRSERDLIGMIEYKIFPGALLHWKPKGVSNA